jgi:glycosyltransferase
LNRYIVRDRIGGLSTNSDNWKLMWKEDIKVYRSHGFMPIPTKIMKMMWKVPQFITAKWQRL